MKAGSYKYIDGRIIKKTMKSLELSGLYIHVHYTLALHAIKSCNTNLTMMQLYELAEQEAMEDKFIEWVEIYTPFRYSRKKKKMVKNEKSRWSLKAAFENPSFTNEGVLESELKNFRIYSGFKEGKAIYLEDFQEYLGEKFEKLDREIEAAIAKNKAKVLSGGKLNNAVLNNLAETDEQAIRKYLQRNPAPDTIGPMGVPQSKYRYGTFGLGSMEYDAWSRS